MIDEGCLEPLTSNFAMDEALNQLGIWFYDWKINFLLVPKDENPASIMRLKVVDEFPFTKFPSHNLTNWNIIQFCFQNRYDINFLTLKEALHRLMLQRKIKAPDVPRCNNHCFGREEASPVRIPYFWSLSFWTSNCFSSIRVGFWDLVLTWTKSSSSGSTFPAFTAHFSTGSTFPAFTAPFSTGGC